MLLAHWVALLGLLEDHKLVIDADDLLRLSATCQVGRAIVFKLARCDEWVSRLQSQGDFA
jgi:hypothetical protein